MNEATDSEEDVDYLHFSVDAVRERLQQANACNDVGPTAAVYCSAILQFLTSKVLNEAVKGIEMENNEYLSPNQEEETKRKRKREQSDDEPPHKKRRICPKDIARALQTDPSLKEWADLIQIPQNNNNIEESTNNATQTHIEPVLNSTSNNCLEGFIIAFEANFEINQNIYCESLKKSLEFQYKQQQKKGDIYKRILYSHKTEAAQQNISGHILSENVCSLIKHQFLSKPTSYCFTYLYHSSTVLSQQLQCATSFGDNHRFFILNRSPVSLLASAMLFMHKKYLSKQDFKLYLNSHQNELFPACLRPDLTIFIIQKEDINDGKRKNRSIFNAYDRCLMSDFFFELLIQRIASRKYGKYIFFHKQQIMQNVSHIIIDILLNKKAVCSIYWESDLKAFNNVQNPNVVNPNRRIVYCQEKQIVDGLNMMTKGELQMCDVVYIHISLWMKPKKEFKRLVLAHLARFESICFYALRHRDLDQRAKQIVQWIFGKIN